MPLWYFAGKYVKVWFIDIRARAVRHGLTIGHCAVRSPISVTNTKRAKETIWNACESWSEGQKNVSVWKSSPFSQIIDGVTPANFSVHIGLLTLQTCSIHTAHATERKRSTCTKLPYLYGSFQLHSYFIHATQALHPKQFTQLTAKQNATRASFLYFCSVWERIY